MVDDSGHLYGITPDGSAVWQYDGTPGQWHQISHGAAYLYAGGNYVFAIDPNKGTIAQYQGTPFSWTQIGDPGKTFTVGSLGQLYRLAPNGIDVYEYSGTPMQWNQLPQPDPKIYTGGYLTNIYAGAGYLNATDAGGDLLQIANPVQTPNSPLPQGFYTTNFSTYDARSGALFGSGQSCFAFNNSKFGSLVFGNIPIVPAPGGWSADFNVVGDGDDPSDHVLVSGVTTGNQIQGIIFDLTHNGLETFTGNLTNSCSPAPPLPQ